MNATPDPAHRPPSPGTFASTQWSIVLRAGQRGSPEAEAALALLCQRYWYPLYAYVRRHVGDVHEAQDLTQAFFARLLEKDTLRRAAPERGRFRSFLLTALKHFLANEWDRGNAQKRGGGRPLLSLDLADGESRFHQGPAHGLTPERTYERDWTLRLLELILERLRAEFQTADRARQFTALQGFLTGDRSGPSYAAVAADLGMTETAVRQAASRLRKRYRELLREEVAQTVAGPEEIDAEIRSLFEALGR